MVAVGQRCGLGLQVRGVIGWVGLVWFWLGRGDGQGLGRFVLPVSGCWWAILGV